MVDPVTLESVLSAFDKWRQYRCSPKESVPKALREQAISLLMQHTQSRVAATLKISHVMSCHVKEVAAKICSDASDVYGVAS